ncbi:MAG: hypothetical protein ABIJ26_07780 [Candidatus Margulisiibacteriota bacterium]|uniref:Uncharacterized protein n=1 Tax=viral metagenome TaxID=1070528 RepID=A0A6H1ZA27_9ZZZZ
MTRNECVKKVDELLLQVKPFLVKEIIRLMNCGGIELGDYENDFEAPKVLLATALLNCHLRYVPLAEFGRADMRNLLKF